jgi:pimeloyl-ACP methyl ester carboxylesterase
MSRVGTGVLGVVVVAGAIALLVWTQLPGVGAGGLLHPSRRRVAAVTPDGCVDASYTGAGVTLKGWRCSAPAATRGATGEPRGTIVYLHGIADNRTSASGVVARFLPRGYDVVAYDSRAHGDSEGDACTYGFFEKQDLHRVIDTISATPIVLIGTSLGAGVAVQEAAEDDRVDGIVAAEIFSDLRTIAIERAPWFFTRGAIDRAIALAESRAQFDVDAVSPLAAAGRVTAPTLVIHGADDSETLPAHSERVYAALQGPKRLILVPGAGHNRSLAGGVWEEIERWIAALVHSRA